MRVLKSYHTFFRYLLSGVLVYLSDFFTFLFINQFLLFHYQTANILGRIAGTIAGFYLHKTFTFKDSNNTKLKKQLIQYLILILSNYGLTILLLEVLFNFVGLNIYISRFIIDIVVVVISYYISKNYIFKTTCKTNPI